VFPVRYELGFYMSEDSILHSHRRQNLKSYRLVPLFKINYFIVSKVKRVEVVLSLTY
jgi:hypothetical protein